jgi:hypothetical protein
MSASRLVLKQKTGWFAAGRETQDAMRLLSDSAFKLYVCLCLNADRRTGTIRVEPAGLSALLDVESRWIDAGLAELRQRGVCRSVGGQFEIEDRFWPYQKERSPIAAPVQDYVRAVQTLFTTPACVRSAFTAADERTATQLYHRGITLDIVRHAIGLGCARRYVAMLNGQTTAPVTSLGYFVFIADEITQQHVPDGYWEHIHRRTAQLERQWLRRRAAALAKACPTSPESRPASPE